MADLQYNFLGDTFTTYQNVDEPTVPTLKTPLYEIETPWADSFITKDDGTQIPLAKSNMPRMIVNNNPEYKNNNPEYKNNQGNSQSQSSINTKIGGDKKQQALNFFINKGLSNHVAAGIVGNLIQESGLKTNIKGDGGKAFGIAQWHPDRQKGLKALADSRGTKIDDFETQLEYVWQELNTTEKGTLSRLLNSRNVDEATTIFMRHFERPNEKYANLTGRIKYANSLLS